MARILYAASGDGYGHAVRLHSVGAGLLARGHDVRFVSSAKTIKYLRSFFPDRVHDTFGLFTIYDQGRAKIWQTVLHNVRRAIDDMGPANRSLRRLLQTFRPDVVITDFEPLSAFWARVHGVPFISLDNQHLLTHCELDRLPGCFGDRLSAYATIRLYYAGARKYLITSFVDAPIRHHPSRLIPPILRPQVYEKQPADAGFLLAYKGANGHNDGLRRALEQFDRLPIKAYGFDRVGQHGHLTYEPTNPDQFLDDLARCRAVVSTAGHSLVSECLHLEKPMLLQPIQGQYEQVLNAHHVQRLGFGRTRPRLRASDLDGFVDDLDQYRQALKTRPKEGFDAVLDLVEKEVLGA